MVDDAFTGDGVHLDDVEFIFGQLALFVENLFGIPIFPISCKRAPPSKIAIRSVEKPMAFPNATDMLRTRLQ